VGIYAVMAREVNGHRQSAEEPCHLLPPRHFSIRKDSNMTDTVVYKDYLGIPRKLIPWFPTIDEELCSNCGLCVKACKHGTYAVSENPDRVIVADPYACEVYCESCRFQCPVGAISFPDRKAFKLIFKELRKQYPPAE